MDETASDDEADGGIVVSTAYTEFWRANFNEVIKFPTGPLTVQNWEIQSNVSNFADSILLGAAQVSTTSDTSSLGVSVCDSVSYNDTDLANVPLATALFKLDIVFKRKSLLPNLGADYADFLFGNLNTDGIGTIKLVTLEVHNGQPYAGIDPNQSYAILIDSVGNQHDIGTITTPGSANNLLTLTRLSATGSSFAVNGTLITNDTQMSWAEVTLNDLALYFAADNNTLNFTTVVSAAISLPSVLNFAATTTTTAVSLSWSAFAGADHYKISRDGGDFSSNVTSPTTDPGQQLEPHFYIIRAYDASNGIIGLANFEYQPTSAILGGRNRYSVSSRNRGRYT